MYQVPKNPNRQIPALSENTWLRYFNFIALYFAQGVPEGMLFFGIPAWMAMHGKTPGEIAGFVVACGLPWSFKFIVAPLMDRYTFLPMGRKRPWVILGQLGLMTSFLIMAFIPDPLKNLHIFMLAGFVVSFFGSFQDVATDGMAVDIVPAEEQARANGLMWGSKIIGTSTSLAIGTWLLNRYNFTVAISMLSIVVFFIMLVPVLLRERPGEKVMPWAKGNPAPENQKLQVTDWHTIFKSLFSVFILRNSLLLAMMAFLLQASINFMDTLLPIFTVTELGWTNVVYSQLYATSALTGGIGGMLVGGFLIDRFGKKRMLNIYFLCFVLSTTELAFMKTWWASSNFITGYMIFYTVMAVFSCIGLFAIAMQCCWKKVSASQFTLYMTIANLGRIAGAALIAPLRANFSWEITILAFAILIGLCWLVMQFLNIDQHVSSVGRLENKDVEKQGMLVTLTPV